MKYLIGLTFVTLFTLVLSVPPQNVEIGSEMLPSLKQYADMPNIPLYILEQMDESPMASIPQDPIEYSKRYYFPPFHRGKRYVVRVGKNP